MLAALPDGVTGPTPTWPSCERDGQIRLWWDDTPVDVFFNTTDFHAGAAPPGPARAVRAASEIPFLACRDLAVFKAFFNRTKDWADLEAMAEAGALDVEAVLGVLTHYLGPDDERLDRLRCLA